jgi:radical SAM superfamily enzyme YgiQ (UPF0313 family)
MRVLLAANHNTLFEFHRLIRFPHLGIASIAANLDKETCDVKVVDLILAGRNPCGVFIEILKNYQPDVVGLSCMVFQYAEALELAKIVRAYDKNIVVVMGGYGPSVIYEEILESDDMDFIDFIIRGEGEAAFNDLIKALNRRIDLKSVTNLSYRINGSIIHNPAGQLIDLDTLKIPDRTARILKKGFHTVGSPADVIETSRGCVHDCSFCTISHMYGKSFRKYKIERIINDIKDARSHGAKSIFIVDDNITLDSQHFKNVSDAIKDAKLNKMRFTVKASVNGLKQNPELIKKMADAGITQIFLGIENFSEHALDFMSKSGQFKQSDTHEVISELKGRGIFIIAGIISGYPDDTEESMWANFKFCQELGIIVPIFYLLTPYPKTRIRDELIKQGLVTNMNDYSRYTGFDANVRTKTLSAERLKEIREEMGFRYPVYSGAWLRLLWEFPILFSAKLFFNQLFLEPGEFIGYTKELFRISNFFKKNIPIKNFQK